MVPRDPGAFTDQIDQHSEHGQDALPIACRQLARDSDTRQLLHDELEDVILDQFDALAGPPTANGLAWAIVNRLFAQSHRLAALPPGHSTPGATLGVWGGGLTPPLIP